MTHTNGHDNNHEFMCRCSDIFVEWLNKKLIFLMNTCLSTLSFICTDKAFSQLERCNKMTYDP